MWRCAIGGIVPRKHKRPRRTFRAAVIRGGGSRIGGYLYYSMAAMDDWTPAAFDRALCDLADAELDDQNDANKAAQQVTATLAKYPDLAGLFAGDGIAGPAAAQGVREAGLKKGQVTILGFDREDSLLAAIQDGDIAGTVIQGSPLEAYMGVMVLDMMSQGIAQSSYDDKAAGVVLAPETINPTVVIADQSNVQYFRRDYKP